MIDIFFVSIAVSELSKRVIMFQRTTTYLSILIGVAVYSVSNALQNGASSSSPSRPRSLGVVQSTRTYPVQTQQLHHIRSFIQPLLPDFHRDSLFEFDHRNKVGHDDDEDDGILDYLPWYVLQDETKQCVNLITKATRQYIYGDTRGDPKVDAQDVFQVIQNEYKSCDVPFRIGDRTYTGVEPQHREVAQILSFAAYHRLPTPIAALLFGTGDLEEYKLSFTTHGGWAGVSFPRGLAIRLPRNRLTKTLDRYQPIPRQFFRTRNVRIAEKCTREAARVQAPPRQLLSRQGFLDSLEKELDKSSSKPWQVRGISPFFPSKRNAFNFVQKRVVKASALMRTVSLRIQQYARATILSYGLLAFAWYNLSLLWQWQRLSITSRLSSSVLLSSLHRIGGIITQVYSNLHIVVPALALALVMAPIANRAMPIIRDRFGVADDNRALLCMGSLLTVSQIGIGASILLLDAAVLRTVFV